MLSTDGLVYDTDFIFSFNNLTFENIEFTTSGKILDFGHQLPKNLTISNSKFSNLKYGRITVQSSNLQSSDLKTYVDISNTVFDDIQQSSFSFINVLEGSVLHISNCSFTNMFSYSKGSVLTGGYRDSLTIISDSRFQNNTALKGGVLNVNEKSGVK